MKVVIFTENNARIVNVDDITPYQAMSNVLINPDITKLTGLAPHFWKKSGNQLLPMTKSEQASRLQHINMVGLKNDYTKYPSTFLSRNKHHIIVLIFGLVMYASGFMACYEHIIKIP